MPSEVLISRSANFHLSFGIPAAENQPGIAVIHREGQIDPAVGICRIRDQLLRRGVVDKELSAIIHKRQGLDPDFARDRQIPLVLPFGRENQVGRRVDIGRGIDHQIPVWENPSRHAEFGNLAVFPKHQSPLLPTMSASGDTDSKTGSVDSRYKSVPSEA